MRGLGFIPAELYGKGLENFHLSVPAKEFKKVFREAGENTVIKVTIDGKNHPAFIHDVSYDPLSGEIQSIDFHQVRMDEKLKVKVPVEFIGVSPAVKEKQGVLVKALQEIEIEALPSDVPRSFKADLQKLADIGQSIYVKDLEMPTTVKALVDMETVVATVTAQVTEEEELAMRQAAGGAEAVKVETEEKKAERETAKAQVVGESASPEAPAKETPKK